MPEPCGKCHRTRKPLVIIGEDQLEYCPACRQFHFYRSHGWVGPDAVNDIGCPRSDTNVCSIRILVEHVYGEHYVEVEYNDDRKVRHMLNDKQMNSLWRMIVRDEPVMELFRSEQHLMGIGRRTVAEYVYT